MPRPELVVALDFQTWAEAQDMARVLSPLAEPGQPGLWMKVGLELFVAEGPSVVRELKRMGFKVFLDLKFLDIPNTVRGAVRSAVRCGADMLNIHAAGGLDMARIAAEARNEAHAELGGGGPRPLLLAVTVLTSMQDADTPILRGRPASEVALELARQSREAGLDGVVCSGQEAARVKQACGPDFLCLTPGIRVPDPDALVPGDDQRRVMTPEAAVAAGADFLVAGRPITRAAKDTGGPAAAARGILERMARAAAAAGR